MRYMALVVILVALFVCCCGGLGPASPPLCDVSPVVVTYQVDDRFYPDEKKALQDALATIEAGAFHSIKFLPGRNASVTYIRARSYLDLPTDEMTTIVSMYYPYNDKVFVAVDQLTRDMQDEDDRHDAMVAIFIHETGHRLGLRHYEGNGESCLYANMHGHMTCANGGLPKADAEAICAKIGCYCREK